MVFILYFILNLLGYLNMIGTNNELFKNNINNLNPIKSIISKIMYYNFFQREETDINTLKTSQLNNIKNPTNDEINTFLFDKNESIFKNTTLSISIINKKKGKIVCLIYSYFNKNTW